MGPGGLHTQQAWWTLPPAGVPRAAPGSPPDTPHPQPGLLPVQDFIPTFHVKPEVRKGNWDRLVLPSNEVPGSVICHFLPFLSVLPAPLTLLIPGEMAGGGTVRTKNPERRRRAWGRALLSGCAYMVCMLALVRSKAQSTVAGSSPDTRLHSMETFNLGGERRCVEPATPSHCRWSESPRGEAPDCR